MSHGEHGIGRIPNPGEHGMGLIGKSPPDYRDRILGGALRGLLSFADYVDLRGTKGDLRFLMDQGQLGSCTANTANTVAEFVEHKDGDPDWDRLSRLWTYYYSRERLGTIDSDSGANLRDAFAVLAEKGAPRETYWPYEVEEFAVDPAVGGGPDAQRSALQHRSIEYLALREGDEGHMASCLSDGYPFSYGFAVYDSFWTIGADGKWSGARGPIDGYHAVTAYGYDFRPGAFGFPEGGWIVRNSWGEKWGDGGYFYVPRAFFVQEAFDPWTIRRVVR